MDTSRCATTPLNGARTDGVGQRLARKRDAGARGLQHLILLRGAVLGRLVLLPRRFGLRSALVVLRLRHDALVEQRLDPGELALRQVGAGLGVLHFGNRVDVERGAAADAEPRLDLSGVRLGLLQLRVGFCRRDPNRARPPATTGAPRSIWRATTRPAVSAATSACSSAISVPVARMNRAIGCSLAATGETATTGGDAGCSLVFARPELQAPATSAAAASRARIDTTNSRDS